MGVGEPEQLLLDDRARAAAIGEEFGLGTLKQMSWNRKFPRYTFRGVWLIALVVIVGLPTVSAFVVGRQYTLPERVIVVTVAGSLFLTCCLIVVIGITKSEANHRLFLYSGGLAQLVHGESEPRVARWADIREFTVEYDESDDSSAHQPTGFSLRTSSGTELADLGACRRRSELRAVVTEAEFALTPLLVPGMIKTCESGEPLDLGGRVRVTRSGISMLGHRFMSWSDLPVRGRSVKIR
jgi:hypothetical protein